MSLEPAGLLLRGDLFLDSVRVDARILKDAAVDSTEDRKIAGVAAISRNLKSCRIVEPACRRFVLDFESSAAGVYLEHTCKPWCRE